MAWLFCQCPWMALIAEGPEPPHTAAHVSLKGHLLAGVRGQTGCGQGARP